jgi:WD40 repeat protein
MLAGAANEWPRVEVLLRGHRGVVSSLAFSQDGKQIVSGSCGTTVRVWDAETGEGIGEPLSDHMASVTCIALFKASTNSFWLIRCNLPAMGCNDRKGAWGAAVWPS